MGYNVMAIIKNDQNGVLAALSVDEKADAVDGMKIGDLELQDGSVALTNAFEIAKYGTDKKWHWMEV